MAILEKEPTTWPANLFDPDVLLDSQHRGADGSRWFVLHTRARMEKSFARFLRAERLAHYYLPQHEQTKKYQRRSVRSFLPLFPGYVFAFGGDEAAIMCRQRREIVNLLPVKDQQRFETQLRGIHRLLDSGAPVTREERLEPGMPAEIVKGPLAGLKGQVLKNHRGGLRFVLQVQFIQQAASVEVDGSDICALD